MAKMIPRFLGFPRNQMSCHLGKLLVSHPSLTHRSRCCRDLHPRPADLHALRCLQESPGKASPSEAPHGSASSTRDSPTHRDLVLPNGQDSLSSGNDTEDTFSSVLRQRSASASLDHRTGRTVAVAAPILDYFTSAHERLLPIEADSSLSVLLYSRRAFCSEQLVAHALFSPPLKPTSA